MRKTILIDTDPGHDDAIAIMTLLAVPETINILGITTVAGNQTIDKVTTNALKIVELAKSSVPVASGSAGPLIRELQTGGDAHGSSGMDGPVLPQPTITPRTTAGVDFQKELIERCSERVTILALGPLTNIARLLQTYPQLTDRIEAIALMGGGIQRGNITPVAEFNIYVDPEAADIVFRSGVPIVMSGLDVTTQAQIYPTQWNALRSGGAASRCTAELLDFYHSFSRKHGYRGSALHDACAAVWLLEPHVFATREYHIAIETKGELTRGMTVADTRRIPAQPPNAKVLVGLQRDAFIALIIEHLATLDQLIAER